MSAGASSALPVRRRTSRVAPDINITPLVDVVLVLLIIFMVVAPQMDQDIPVDLPGIFNPDPDAEGQREPLIVSVTKGREYFVDTQRYDLDGAVAALTAVHAAEPNRRIALRADASLDYNDVRDIFLRLQEVGFPGMSLLVSHKASRDRPAAADDEKE